MNFYNLRSRIARLAFLLFSPHFVFAMLHPYEVDNKMHQQAVIFDWRAANNYYCKKIPIETFLSFLDIYQKKPKQDNQWEMRSQRCFFLWYLLKEINPSLVIESSIYKGQGTWIIEQAVPLAEVITIDPGLTHRSGLSQRAGLGHRTYISDKATYTTNDFSLLMIEAPVKGPTVCFFYERQNAFDRVMQAYEKGIKHLIFADNYRPGYNKFSPSQLTLRECFELEEHKERALVLNKVIKRYLIMPQIVGNIGCNSCDGKNVPAKAPALWPLLDHIDVSLRDRMKVFYNESIYYSWITYVELY